MPLPFLSLGLTILPTIPILAGLPNAASAPAQGPTSYGSTGLSGELVVAAGETRVIDLSFQGQYVGDEWVVRFDYVRVDIGTNATVTFLNHWSRAPVAWIVQQDVFIAAGAVVDLSGKNGTTATGGSIGYGEPGPGGFRGGRSSATGNDGSGSAGFGMGGAIGSPTDTQYAGAGGSYRTVGGWGGNGHPSMLGQTYGGAGIFQLIGGSGGGGGEHNDTLGSTGGGGGGGGALLIAADGSVVVDGKVRANGGTGGHGSVDGGGGSGGAIRLASLTEVEIGALGRLEVNWGAGGSNGSWSGGNGGFGRIRIETPGALPSKSGGVPADASYGEPQLAFPLQPPRLWIASIGGQPTPAQATLEGGLGFAGEDADMLFFDPGSVDIVVDSQNLPLDSLVYLRIGRAKGHADLLGPLTLVAGTAVTFADIDLSKGFSALQARAVLPQP